MSVYKILLFGGGELNDYSMSGPNFSNFLMGEGILLLWNNEMLSFLFISQRCNILSITIIKWHINPAPLKKKLVDRGVAGTELDRA